MRGKHDETNMAAIEKGFHIRQDQPSKETLYLKSSHLKFPEFGKAIQKVEFDPCPCLYV